MLHHLAVELLVLIAKELNSQLDAFQFSRTCRSTYIAVSPYVFTTIRYDPESTLELSFVVHHLIEHPEYRTGVRCIIPAWKDDPPASQIGKFESATLRKALQKFGVTVETMFEWLTELERQDELGPWMALLLILAPNLQTLHMTPEIRMEHIDHLMRLAVREIKPFDTQPFLSSLKDVDIEGKLYVIADVMAWFRLPKLRQFRSNTIGGIYGVLDRSMDWEKGEVSNVNKIEVTSTARQISLDYMIRACRRLETFTYVHWYMEDTFDPQAIYKSLCRHEGSLENLNLFFKRRYLSSLPEAPGPRGNDFLGSLANFTALKCLRIRSLNILCWADGFRTDKWEKVKLPLIKILPPSLISISFKQTPAYAVKCLLTEVETLVRHKTKAVPSLSRIFIQGEYCLNITRDNSYLIDKTMLWIRPVDPTAEPINFRGKPLGGQQILRLHNLCEEENIYFNVREWLAEPNDLSWLMTN